MKSTTPLRARGIRRRLLLDRRRLDAQHAAVLVVDEHIEQLVGSLAHVPDAHLERHEQVNATISTPLLAREIESRLEKIREAKMKGYEGDSCGECGNFTLVRNGTCMKCTTCGSTSGCS